MFRDILISSRVSLTAMAELSPGMAAPDFTLPDADDQPVSLQDMRGAYVVVYFYPKDNTSACTLEARSFTEEMEEFERLNARVIGISPDPPRSHKRFAEKHNLSVHLLSNPDHDVIAAYGAWVRKKRCGREYEGVDRSTFIIDPEGKIVAVWRNVKVDGHVDEVKAKLEELAASSAAS